MEEYISIFSGTLYKVEGLLKAVWHCTHREPSVLHPKPVNNSCLRCSDKKGDAHSFTEPSSSCLFFSYSLEPLLPKKLHTKSQDKLDRDETDKERKEKKKEKRNSKHQEIFDKEMKTTEIPMQPTEAVILSETVLKKWPVPVNLHSPFSFLLLVWKQFLALLILFLLFGSLTLASALKIFDFYVW